MVHCLRQFLAALLLSCRSFACRTDHISQLRIMLWKDKAENSRTDEGKNLLLLFSHDDSSLEITSSEPVDNRLTIQEGKQTRQESVNTSKSMRSNQALVRNVDCHGESQSRGYQKWCCYLSGLHKIRQ